MHLERILLIPIFLKNQSISINQPINYVLLLTGNYAENKLPDTIVFIVLNAWVFCN